MCALVAMFVHGPLFSSAFSAFLRYARQQTPSGMSTPGTASAYKRVTEKVEVCAKMDCHASNITVFYLNWFSKALTELIRVKYSNINSVAIHFGAHLRTAQQLTLWPYSPLDFPGQSPRDPRCINAAQCQRPWPLRQGLTFHGEGLQA